MVNSGVGMCIYIYEYVYTPRNESVKLQRDHLKGNYIFQPSIFRRHVSLGDDIHISRSSTWWPGPAASSMYWRHVAASRTFPRACVCIASIFLNPTRIQNKNTMTAEVTTNFNYAILRSQIPALLDLVDPEYLHQWQVASWCGVNSNAPFAHKVLELSWLWLCH